MFIAACRTSSQKLFNVNRLVIPSLRFYQTIVPAASTPFVDRSSKLNLYNILDKKKFEIAKQDIECALLSKSFNRLGFKCEEGVTERLIKCLDYAVDGGKAYRACAFLSFIQSLTNNRFDERIVYQLAVAIEIAQGLCLIADDIVDESITRRGRECWHRTVGVSVINDIGLLREVIQFILIKCMKHHKHFIYFDHLLTEMIRIGYFGQQLDLETCLQGQNGNISMFTMDRFRDIMIKKGSFTVLVFPLRSALYFAGNDDENIHSAIEQLAIDIGILFGMQDDYIDVYGDPKLTGKIGTDIQEGKCTWFAATAVQLATDEQREILSENFGKPYEHQVAIVKEVYNDLNLKSAFFTSESQLIKSIETQIEKIGQHANISTAVLNDCLEALQERYQGYVYSCDDIVLSNEN